MTRYSHPLTLHAVGDLMPGVSSFTALASGRTIPDQIGRSPRALVEGVRPLFRENDMLLGNLECPLVRANVSPSEMKTVPFLLGSEKSVELLTFADFDCVSLANNHMLDHGLGPVSQTVDILVENDIDFVGDPFQLYPTRRYVQKDREIVVGGFNLCREGKQDSVAEIVEFLEGSAEADVRILLLHWGWQYEQLPYPSPNQVKLGHKLIDTGADVVIGCHSHVFQPVEHYADGVIAYSLGNFLFDMGNPITKKTGVLEITHTRTGELDVAIHPLTIESYAISRSDRDMDRFIRDSPPPIPSDIERKAKLQRIKTKLNLFTTYVKNMHRIPISDHRNTMDRWSRKLLPTR